MKQGSFAIKTVKRPAQDKEDDEEKTFTPGDKRLKGFGIRHTSSPDEK